MKDLREKFKNILVFNYQRYITTEEAENECVKIAESHAKDETIGFVEWCGEYYVKMHIVWCPRYADQRDKNNWKETSELYEIYQQQKEK